MATLVACAQKATGHFPSTLLLLRLAYWTPRARIERDGHRWIVKTGAEWQEETGLTAEQYKDAVRVLKRKSLITAEAHLFRNRRATFMRLTDRGKGCLEAPIDKGQMAPITKEPNGTDLYTESYDTEIDTDALTSIGAVAPVTEKLDSEGIQGECQGMVTKANPYKNLTVAEIMEASKIKPDPVKKEYSDLFWKSLMAQHGITCVSVTVAETAMLKKIEKHLSRPDIMKIVSAWTAFTLRVKFSTGQKIAPGTPSIGYLLKHVNIAVSFLNPSEITKLPQLMEADYAEHEVQLVAQQEKKITLSDILADEDEE